MSICFADVPVRQCNTLCLYVFCHSMHAFNFLSANVDNAIISVATIMLSTIICILSIILYLFD